MIDLTYKILLLLFTSFILFAIVFYIIKACQACCRINFKYVIEGKYENEPTEVLEESIPYLTTEYPRHPQDDSFMFASLPQNSSLNTPVSTEEQFPPMESSQSSNSISIIRPSSTFLNHNDDPPSYEEAMRMSLN